MQKANCFFLKKWANHRPLIRFFILSNITIFATNKCEKYPWCWYLNPRPLEIESPSVTTRPGLPPRELNCLNWKTNYEKRAAFDVFDVLMLVPLVLFLMLFSFLSSLPFLTLLPFLSHLTPLSFLSSPSSLQFLPLLFDDDDDKTVFQWSRKSVTVLSVLWCFEQTRCPHKQSFTYL